jgi:hypothetical protein
MRVDNTAELNKDAEQGDRPMHPAIKALVVLLAKIAVNDDLAEREDQERRA